MGYLTITLPMLIKNNEEAYGTPTMRSEDLKSLDTHIFTTQEDMRCKIWFRRSSDEISER